MEVARKPTTETYFYTGRTKNVGIEKRTRYVDLLEFSEIKFVQFLYLKYKKNQVKKYRQNSVLKQ